MRAHAKWITKLLELLATLNQPYILSHLSAETQELFADSTMVSLFFRT